MPNRLVLIALAALAAVLVVFALGQSGPDLNIPTAPGAFPPEAATTPPGPTIGGDTSPPSSTAPVATSPSDYISEAAKMLIMLVIALGAGAYLLYNWWKDGRD